jgi:hypothetical protein
METTERDRSNPVLQDTSRRSPVRAAQRQILNYSKGYKMTRKDYEIIAAEFKRYADCDNDHFARLDAAGFEPEAQHRARYSRLLLLANSLANRMLIDNPRFEHAKFIKACGL